MTKIYVIIKVTYDWHRFEEFITATTDKKKVDEVVSKIQKDDPEEIPVKRYKDQNSAIAEKMHKLDQKHIWIKEIEE